MDLLTDSSFVEIFQYMQFEIRLRSVSPFEPEVSSLIDALDFYQDGLYPAESNHLDSRQTLSESTASYLEPMSAANSLVWLWQK